MPIDEIKINITKITEAELLLIKDADFLVFRLGTKDIPATQRAIDEFADYIGAFFEDNQIHIPAIVLSSFVHPVVVKKINFE